MAKTRSGGAKEDGTAASPLVRKPQQPRRNKEVFGIEHYVRVGKLAAFSLALYVGMIGVCMSFQNQEHLGVRLGQLAAMTFGVQWIGYTFSAMLKTEKFYDMFGTGSFLLLTAYVHHRSGQTPRPTLRTDIVMCMVFAWGMRLGSYLVRRIWRDGHDKRFDGVKTDPVMFWVYWTLQGVWVFVTTLPVSVLCLRPEGWDLAFLKSTDMLGISVWSLGFVIESVADWQKDSFRSDPNNAGEFIRSGLWKHCRHPNYFGEVLVWIGITMICLTVLPMGYQLLCFQSPVFLSFLLTQMSGVPILEKSAWKRWGHRADYQEYVAHSRVMVLLPWAPRKRPLPMTHLGESKKRE
jgi:steroid 5-alpha reductase family enzyme